MRFERKGGPPDLQAAFTSFVLSRLRGRSLDDNHAAESQAGRFPDFACFRGLLLIEMKHLEVDQHDRINEVLDKSIDPKERKVFYGTMDSKFVIGAASNADEIKATISSKLARTIEKLLRAANSQFEQYCSRHPRKNSVRVCVILNASLREWSPDVLAHSIHSKMKDGIRFTGIDAVLFISEKHMRVASDGRPAHGIIIYETKSGIDCPWKMQVIEKVVNEWSLFRTGSPALEEDDRNFHVLEDIPDTMAVSDRWRLEYVRKPYLQALSLELFRIQFNRAVAANLLSVGKGSWPKPDQVSTINTIRLLTHVNEEASRRGLDVRVLDKRLMTDAETARAYAGFPRELVDMLYGRGEM